MVSLCLASNPPLKLTPSVYLWSYGDELTSVGCVGYVIYLLSSRDSARTRVTCLSSLARRCAFNLPSLDFSQSSLERETSLIDTVYST